MLLMLLALASHGVILAPALGVPLLTCSPAARALLLAGGGMLRLLQAYLTPVCFRSIALRLRHDLQLQERGLLLLGHAMTWACLLTTIVVAAVAGRGAFACQGVG